MYLVGSLADVMLADAILIPPHSPILPTNIRKVSGRRKSTEIKDVGMAKSFSKKYGNKG